MWLSISVPSRRVVAVVLAAGCLLVAACGSDDGASVTNLGTAESDSASGSGSGSSSGSASGSGSGSSSGSASAPASTGVEIDKVQAEIEEQADAVTDGAEVDLGAIAAAVERASELLGPLGSELDDADLLAAIEGDIGAVTGQLAAVGDEVADRERDGLASALSSLGANLASAAEALGAA